VSGLVLTQSCRCDLPAQGGAGSGMHAPARTAFVPALGRCFLGALPAACQPGKSVLPAAVRLRGLHGCTGTVHRHGSGSRSRSHPAQPSSQHLLRAEIVTPPTPETFSFFPKNSLAKRRCLLLTVGPGTEPSSCPQPTPAQAMGPGVTVSKLLWAAEQPQVCEVLEKLRHYRPWQSPESPVLLRKSKNKAGAVAKMLFFLPVSSRKPHPSFTPQSHLILKNKQPPPKKNQHLLLCIALAGL